MEYVKSFLIVIGLIFGMVLLLNEETGPYVFIAGFIAFLTWMTKCYIYGG